MKTTKKTGSSKAKATKGTVRKSRPLAVATPHEAAAGTSAPAEKKAKAAKPKAERKPGLVTLAVEVLAEAKTPMDCKAIVEKVLAKGTWKTSGKTPAATLYSAIIREIAKAGDMARFRKVDRGQFELAAAK